MLNTPLALISLAAAVPALLAVYLLRNRVKQRDVSSLMLWIERRRMTHGGGRLQRSRLPLLFFLELLIILLLIAAAATPLILSDRAHRPVVIVLDNSASMAAVGPDGKNAAQRALADIPKQLRAAHLSPVRVLLAGSDPRWLDETAAQKIESGRLPSEWTLNAADFNDERALLLARRNSTPGTRILVVSDTPTSSEPESGKLKWLAAGRTLPNAGFINAVRSGDRCMLEIAGSGTTELTLKTGASSRTVSVDLPIRKTIQLSDPTARFEAVLPDDALAIDNRVILLPEPDIQIPVLQSVQNPKLRELTAQAVEATGLATDGTPELTITDSSSAAADINTWTLHLIPAEQAQPFTGPFVIDRSSPLTDGLSFEGVVWGASPTNRLPGMPIVMAGNVPLLTRQEDLAGRVHFYLQIDPSISTLPRSPAWPTLFWNLLQARAALQPGFADVNLREGMDIVFQGLDTVRPPEQPGIINVDFEGQTYRAAFNFLDAEESELAACGSEDQGSWIDPENIEREYADLSPILILAAMALLALHQFLLRREQRIMG